VAPTAGAVANLAELVIGLNGAPICYWAAFSDERGVSQYSLTTDRAFAELSPENADSRATVIAAFDGAIERYRVHLDRLRSIAS
jgi:hypothetical protein